MSKTTHQKNLARARAKRAHEQSVGTRQTRALKVVLLIAAAVLVGWLVLRGGDDTPSNVPVIDPDADTLLFDEDQGPAEAPEADGFESEADELSDGAIEPQVLPDSYVPLPLPAALENPEPCDVPEGTARDLPATYDAPPAAQLEPDVNYAARFTTTCGDITFDLLPEANPTGVPVFVQLVRDGYYDGTPFHRVIEGFMAQGGDPAGTGNGFPDDPEYNGPPFPGFRFTADTTFAEELTTNAGAYPRGWVAFANAGGPDSSGGQFFIMHEDTPLPPLYGVFGAVTSGINVVDRIVQGPVQGDQAITPVIVTKAEIIETAADSDDESAPDA